MSTIGGKQKSLNGMFILLQYKYDVTWNLGSV